MEDQHSPIPPEEEMTSEEKERREPTREVVQDTREEDDDLEKNPKEVEHTLLQDESIKIDIQSDDDNRATLPLREKNRSNEESQKATKYLFPITRMKTAWAKSSSIGEFFFKAIFIIFSTLGWMFCIGGIPFISLALLIMGSLYKNDCKIQPNLPMYLIVAGALGTLQHFIAIWTKYLPRESQGPCKNCCRVIDSLLHLFLTIWFVLGCIWVYGVYSEVEYRDTTRDEYCHQTVYLFAFWILNFSFMILAFLCVTSLGIILCIVASPKDK
ncbi:uncharacterized protein TNCT_443041 [Trichonephila clavata]|uniref:Uncharacterized protein n=1 Tax=Trichonephila clavata TaxID=2740835 RepID=A0A8X6I0R0_TRICU|nr:uncharacterized protein TNCT_443041 [Trichonephila clavata]